MGDGVDRRGVGGKVNVDCEIRGDGLWMSVMNLAVAKLRVTSVGGSPALVPLVVMKRMDMSRAPGAVLTLVQVLICVRVCRRRGRLPWR